MTFFSFKRISDLIFNKYNNNDKSKINNLTSIRNLNGQNVINDSIELESLSPDVFIASDNLLIATTLSDWIDFCLLVESVLRCIFLASVAIFFDLLRIL